MTNVAVNLGTAVSLTCCRVSLYYYFCRSYNKTLPLKLHTGLAVANEIYHELPGLYVCSMRGAGNESKFPVE